MQDNPPLITALYHHLSTWAPSNTKCVSVCPLPSFALLKNQYQTKNINWQTEWQTDCMPQTRNLYLKLFRNGKEKKITHHLRKSQNKWCIEWRDFIDRIASSNLLFPISFSQYFCLFHDAEVQTEELGFLGGKSYSFKIGIPYSATA